MFTLIANFCDFLKREATITETTDNWAQAFGTFIIRVSDPDCFYCEVSHKDSQGYSRLDLIYNTHEE